MRESQYQSKLVKKLEDLFPGCFIMKNDPDEIQGLPDLLILFCSRWAMLEVKMSMTADVQPNQEYYVDKFDGMSFASFIYPENEDRVLYELQDYFDS